MPTLPVRKDRVVRRRTKSVYENSRSSVRLSGIQREDTSGQGRLGLTVSGLGGGSRPRVRRGHLGSASWCHYHARGRHNHARRGHDHAGGGQAARVEAARSETAGVQAARVQATGVEAVHGLLLVLLLLVSRFGEIVDPELSAEGWLLAVVDALLRPVTVVIRLAAVLLALHTAVADVALAAGIAWIGSKLPLISTRRKKRPGPDSQP